MSGLPLFDTVRQQRDDAMQRVAQKAEDHRPSFSQDAETCALNYLRANGPTPGEQLTIACKNAGIVPHNDRAFGPVYARMAKRGLIVKVGECKRMRGHGTSGGNVWGLAS